MAHKTQKHCNISTTTQDLPKENKSTCHKHQRQKKVSSLSLPHIPVRCQQKSRDWYFTSLPTSANVSDNEHRSCKRNETQNTPFLPIIPTDNSPLISVLKSHINSEKINSNNVKKLVKRKNMKKQREATEASTVMPIRTPEPEVLQEFNVFIDGFAVVDEVHRKHSSYIPKYCWCTRCQMMYRMYKEGDKRLETWGNYPCFKF